MNTSKLESIEAIALISIIMINKIILNIPKTIIKSCGSGAWLNIIYISAITLSVVWLVTKLFKKFPKADILDISEYVGGKKLKCIIGIFHILFFLVITSLILRNFSETLKIIFLNNSPIIFIISFFVVGACFACNHGLKSIAKTNLIIAPIVFLSILLIIALSYKNIVIERLFPILGYGINETFFSGLTNLFSFTGMAYLLFLKPFLKDTTKFKKIALISTIISAIYLLLSVAALLLVFSYITDSQESISIYLLTRMINFGEFFQRSNSLFILIWLMSVLSYISIALFFAVYITKKITRIESTTPINYCYGSILVALALIAENFAKYINFTENIISYSAVVFLFVINLLILIAANLKHKPHNKKHIGTKFFKAITAVLITICPILSLSGCYDAKGIEELAYAVAIGIDTSETNNIKLTFQFANGNNGENEESKSSSQSKQTSITSVDCCSINSGISLVNSHISKKVNLSHCQILVISEDLAKLGIVDYMDTLSNNVEIYPDCSVIISKSSAKDYINSVQPSLETLTARFYESTLNSSLYTGYTVNVNLSEFYSNIKSNTSEAYAILGGLNTNSSTQDLKQSSSQQDSAHNSSNSSIINNANSQESISNSSIANNSNSQESSSNSSIANNSNSQESNSNSSIEKKYSNSTEGDTANTIEQNLNADYTAGNLPVEDSDKIETIGIAAFKGDKFVGELSGLDSICQLMITNELESCIITLPNPNTENKYVDLSITSSRPSTQSVTIDKNNIPQISVDIHLVGYGLSLDTSTNYDVEDDLEKIRINAENYITSAINNYLTKITQEYKSDICGFGNYLLSQYPTLDEWKKSDWLNNYQNAKFNVKVDLILKSGNVFSGS